MNLETMCSDTRSQILNCLTGHEAVQLGLTCRTLAQTVRKNLYEIQTLVVRETDDSVIHSICKTFATKRLAFCYLEKLKETNGFEGSGMKIGEVRISNEFENYFSIHSV
jgi:hypothetical protein